MKALEKMFKEAGLYSLDSPWVIEATDEKVFAVVKAYMEKVKALSPLEQSENKDEWVSCKDRLPSTSDRVLCYTHRNSVMIGWYNTVHKWWLVDMNQSFGYEHTKVLSWQPLPKPPKNLV